MEEHGTEMRHGSPCNAVHKQLLCLFVRLEYIPKEEKSYKEVYIYTVLQIYGFSV